MGTGFYPGVKRPRRDVDHPPLLTPRLKKEYRYTCIPLCTFTVGYKVNVTLFNRCNICGIIIIIIIIQHCM